MIASKTTSKIVSCIRRYFLLVVTVFVVGSCSSTSDNPTDSDLGLIYPTVPIGAGVQQCRSEAIRTDGETVIYRNTYISIDDNGTETVQSQSESAVPCS